MSTQGVGTFAINSFWESGRLIFYEKAYGHTTTGDVFILGADYVQVGDTANDVDFKWYGTTTGSFILDAAAHTLAMTGMATSTDGVVTITDATATSSTTTGALIVTGGIATAADITCGDDLFMSNGGVINWNGGEVTLTNGTSTLDIASTWTAGMSDELLSAVITTTATLGSYANAVFGKIDASTTGKSVGTLAAVGAEIDVATAGTQGGYWCYQGDMNFPTGATITPWGSAAGFFYLSAWGSGISDFDTDGRLFSINGLTAAAGKLLSANKQTLKVDFDNGTTRYMVLSQTENGLGIGVSGTEASYTAGSPLMTLYATAAGSGSTNCEPFYMYSILTGTSPVGGRARFHTYTNVVAGSWVNSIKGLLEFGTNGRTIGLASAILGELALNAATNIGSYACFEAEISGNSAVLPTSGTGGFFFCNGSGTNVDAQIDSLASLFVFGDGLDAASGKFIDTDKTALTAYGGIRIYIEGVGIKWIPVVSA